ncbi:MAG: peptide chain release factor N(5)-glutamine methyltransferase [Gammaproteobacteria bacterium]|nr:peptide chain release factor N(5)-glutamine methyltransferase [Gammaproteobacteria bacterium]
MAEDAQIGTLLKELSQALAGVSESPRLDAEILVGRAIDMPRSYLFAHPEDSLDESAVRRLEQSLERRLKGEPMAYITGIREFWSMELAVSPATLVPRPETEILVDKALARIPRKANWTILDLGTGSGAIALAIARERPLCNVTGVDISREALDVARLNARELAIPNVSFLESDWIEAIRDQQFDVVVSNPPYVRDDDDALRDLVNEPQGALAAGHDGLDALRILARDCLSVLVPGGLLGLEHGAEQQAAVASLLAEHGWLEIENHRDYAGLPRVTTARAAPAAEL